MRPTTCVFVLVGAMAAAGGFRQQPPVVKTTTAGVVIDATVLDANGRPVLDLGPGDFELTENGTRQQILSVTLIQGGIARASTAAVPLATSAAAAPVAMPPAPGTPAAAAAPAITPSVTAIVFDRLSPEVRPLARRAALAYLETLTPPNDYAGVFLADLTLTTYQPFTNQQERLRVAVDRMSATAPANLADVDRFKGRYAPMLDPNQPATAGAESSAGFSIAERQRILSLPNPERRFAEMELRMESGYRQFLAELGGQASLAGLRSTVEGLGMLPGRKSILYFTESLTLSTTLKSKFDAIIGLANRASITVYPVDAVGLRVHSKEGELARNVNVAGRQNVGDESRGDGPWTKDLEKQDQLLSSRPTAALGRLATETGGFLLENTNDLSAGVARMQVERTTYYLLAYQSTDTALDGTFRKVSVKVKRPKVTIKARPGYLAIPSGAL
jgi:VWFA-related protein